MLDHLNEVIREEKDAQFQKKGDWPKKGWGGLVRIEL